MPYSVCVEEMEGLWIAHVPELPGCFSTAKERDTAVADLPETIRGYWLWRAAHGDSLPVPPGPFDLRLDEIVREWASPSEADDLVNAFFADDARPLGADEISEALRLLEWSRQDLLAAVADLSVDEMGRPVEGEWTIAGILNHTGRAEWWYLDRLGLAPDEPRPAGWQALVQRARSELRAVLPGLAGIGRIVLRDDELWSPRKMLRRSIWHERDHTAHIWQFRRVLGRV
jgi:predicted RNase H-like HicB family nuclease